MGVAFIANPAPLWDYYVGGPYPSPAAVWNDSGAARSGAVMGLYTPNIDTASSARDTWQYSQGGSGATEVHEYYENILCTQMGTSNVAAVNSLNGISFQINTAPAASMSPGYTNPSWQRVNIFRANLAMDIGSLDRSTGLLFMRSGFAQSGQEWPVTPGMAGGFGVFGDAAGNWNFEIFSDLVAGGPPNVVRESVSLIANVPNPELWNTFEFVGISGAGGREPSLQLWINGALILERGFGASPLIPRLAAPAAPVGSSLTFRFFPSWQVGTTTSELMYWGNWDFRMGRFTRSGRELFR